MVNSLTCILTQRLSPLKTLFFLFIFFFILESPFAYSINVTLATWVPIIFGGPMPESPPGVPGYNSVERFSHSHFPPEQAPSLGSLRITNLVALDEVLKVRAHNEYLSALLDPNSVYLEGDFNVANLERVDILDPYFFEDIYWGQYDLGVWETADWGAIPMIAIGGHGVPGQDVVYNPRSWGDTSIYPDGSTNTDEFAGYIVDTLGLPGNWAGMIACNFCSSDAFAQSLSLKLAQRGYTNLKVRGMIGETNGALLSEEEFHTFVRDKLYFSRNLREVGVNNQAAITAWVVDKVVDHYTQIRNALRIYQGGALIRDTSYTGIRGRPRLGEREEL